MPHASELTPATRRYWLTADGLRRLAREEGADVDGLLRSRPVSNQWRRLLMERLDAVAAVYRVASAVSTLAHPIRFRWFRGMPMDASVALPDGRVIAVVRQGPATDRTGFSKRLWRLREVAVGAVRVPGSTALELVVRCVGRQAGATGSTRAGSVLTFFVESWFVFQACRSLRLRGFRSPFVQLCLRNKPDSRREHQPQNEYDPPVDASVRESLHCLTLLIISI